MPGARWMQCMPPVNAPWHDLCLVHQLLRYEAAVDQQVGKSALHAFSRHHRYLTEMVPLALFSELVPEQYRWHDLATRLLQRRPENMLPAPAERFGAGYGKTFPANISLETSPTWLDQTRGLYSVSSSSAPRTSASNLFLHLLY